MTSCALSVNTQKIMQHGMNCLCQGCDNFGLTKKTGVMYQPAPGKPYQEPHITVNGQNLQAVDNFTYQGSTLSRVVHIDMLKSTTGLLGPQRRLRKTPGECLGADSHQPLYILSWRFTVQCYSSLFSTHVRPGLCTADTYTPTRLKISTWAASAGCSTLDGKTKILIWRS